jgi:hypothetical protein
VKYRIVWPEKMRDKLASWRLPDELLVDVYQRAFELEERPAERLVRYDPAFDGMTLRFSVVDPKNRFAEYRIALLVVYGQDEMSLHIVNGICNISFI